MSRSFFQNLMLSLTVAAMLLVAAVAYGRYRAEGNRQQDSCIRVEPAHNTELPWEALATRWFRAVSL